MKKTFRLMATGVAAMLLFSTTSCSKDDDGPENPDDYFTVTIGFKNVPDYLIGGPTSYGENLYPGSSDQITTGYITEIYGNTYAQFSINYGATYDTTNPYGYTFFAGGMAITNWYDTTDDDPTYNNQLSVYAANSPSGKNCVIASGYSTFTGPDVDIMSTKYSDYASCGRVYITDATGYRAPMTGGTAITTVTGEDEDAFFKSVMINNTTYGYYTMKDGDAFASPLNEENKGWLKVQFIAFEDDDSNEMPLGVVEAYLANFNGVNAAGKTGILDEWTQVDLSSLPECSILVINFVGSDTGEYGLNTPGYCALDNFVISVEKDND